MNYNNVYREFFKLSFKAQEQTPVEDYRSIFATVPLLADVGEKVTVLHNSYNGNHPYNGDHDLLGLTMSTYFGTKATIQHQTYSNIFDYIQKIYFDPIGIVERTDKVALTHANNC